MLHWGWGRCAGLCGEGAHGCAGRAMNDGCAWCHWHSHARPSSPSLPPIPYHTLICHPHCLPGACPHGPRRGRPAGQSITLSNQNGAISESEMYFDPSTFGAPGPNGPNQNTPLNAAQRSVNVNVYPIYCMRVFQAVVHNTGLNTGAGAIAASPRLTFAHHATFAVCVNALT